MCGITGIVTKNARRHDSILQKMTDKLSHRGPDGGSLYFFDSCGLGHRRLAIVDLQTGGQPMLSQDKQKAVTFNGEIFGFKDIRASLSDYAFKTTSDTELILALYEKYDEGFLEYLPGQFAFALYDDTKQKLICARDRFGEKPFYYALTSKGEFIFASEIKALLSSNLIKPKLRLTSLAHYLKKLYIHPFHTIYENIYTLPPAHILVFEGGEVKVRRYWYMKSVDHSISLGEASGEVERLLRESVKKQLIADVPVGAFLSGGIDSTTIVALGSEYKKDLKTFSFGFGDSMNELPYAKEVAVRYKTDHTELQAKPHTIGELLLKMGEVYDEPFGDSSNIPTYLISEAASKHVKVALTGDGGDEFFGGYLWYKPLLHLNRDLASRFISARILYVLAKASKKISHPGSSFLYNALMGRSYAKLHNSALKAHESSLQIFDTAALKELALKDFRGADIHIPSWQEYGTIDDAFRFDIENYMPGDILVKTDRASMAHGLELRAPFLDVDLASFCLSLPNHLKITRTDEKFILKYALNKIYPESVLKRKKQGFGAPVSSWLKDDSVRKLKQGYLENPSRKIFSFLSFKKLASIIKEDNYKTWTLLVLSLWLEKNYE